MKHILTLASVLALVLLAPLAFALNGPHVSGPPFKIRVLDHMGNPVRGVVVTADNGLTCRTNANGETWWSEVSVRRPGVRFRFEAEHVKPTRATFDVAGGVTETLTIHRLQE